MLTNFSMKGRWWSNNYACGCGLSLFTLRLGYISLRFRTLFQITRLPCTELLVSVITGGNSLLESAKADHANKQKFCSFEKNMNHTMKWSSYKTLGQIS